jgi:uncharacterized alpha-E superfamily protein
MLRVALPPGDDPSADGQAIALLHAVGGFQAYRRAVPAPPNARPVARFLLFERDYPDSVSYSIDALHAALTAADASYRSSPAVLRLSRLMADLDFRARTPIVTGSIATTLEVVQGELGLVDADIAGRYFGNPAQPAARPVPA